MTEPGNPKLDEPGANRLRSTNRPTVGSQGVRLPGPNACGNRLPRSDQLRSPSQIEKMTAFSRNSLITCRQAPQGAVGSGVGV